MKIKKIYTAAFIKKNWFLPFFSPVGALSPKTEAFSERPWELVYKILVDSTNSFGLYTNVAFFQKEIKKIQPAGSLNSDPEAAAPWVDNKTRFFFDGLSSLDYLLEDLLLKKKKNMTKKSVVKNIVMSFYLIDHLNYYSNSYFFKKIVSCFIFILGTSISLETFSLLLSTFHKYSFLKIKTAEIIPPKNNLEGIFQINSSLINSTSLTNSDLCLLISVNTRYEGAPLNMKLRSRYLKFDFSVLSIGALLDLTFPIFVLGSTTKTLNSTVEGNHLCSQRFRVANYPTAILNSDYFRRIDTNCIFILIEIFKSYTYFTLKNWNGLNVLNHSLNDVGITSLNRTDTLKMLDLKKFSTFYLINTPLYMSGIRIILELKLLSFCSNEKKFPSDKSSQTTLFSKTKILFNQHYRIPNSFWFIKKIKKCFYLHNYFNIPTKNFFEIGETYKNTEGIIKKSVNVVKSKFALKTDWQLLRRVFKKTKNKLFCFSDAKDYSFVYFNAKDVFKFKNFMTLQFSATKTFNYSAFYHLSESTIFNFNTASYFFYVCKSFNTKIKFWIEDFFIGGRDLYSRHSITMIQCSQLLRDERYTFDFKSVALEEEDLPSTDFLEEESEEGDFLAEYEEFYVEFYEEFYEEVL